MTTHTLTIDRPDAYTFTVVCPCGFRACACTYEAARDSAKGHLGLPIGVTR